MNQNQKEEGASNSGDSSARPANGSNEVSSSEAVARPYAEAIADAMKNANNETELSPVIKSTRGKERFVPNSDNARIVKVMLPLNADSEIGLKRTSKSPSEGATIGIKEISRLFGPEVLSVRDKTQVEFLIADGRSLKGYVLRRPKSVRIYLPKPYLAGIEVPELGYAQPVRVVRLIVG